VKTTGSYGADLAAAGTVPEDIGLFGDVISKELCKSSLSPNDPLQTFRTSVKQFGMPGGAAGGRSPSVVRLTVAYFCPERTAAAEGMLKDLGYTK
jgi:hypothetical protein